MLYFIRFRDPANTLPGPVYSPAIMHIQNYFRLRGVGLGFKLVDACKDVLNVMTESSYYYIFYQQLSSHMMVFAEGGEPEI